MKLKEMILLALEGLRANKLRSVLTMLGVIIGVTVIILIITLGLSLSEETNIAAANMGVNSFIIFPGTDDDGKKAEITVEDCRFITNAVKSIEVIVPEQWPDNYPIIKGPRKQTPWITMGVGSDYPAISGLEIIGGRFFSQVDDDLGRKVVVVSEQLVKDLFGPGIDGVGKTIRINGNSFVICGVTNPMEQIGGMKFYANYIPLKTMLNMQGDDRIRQVGIRIKSGEPLQPNIERITNLLELRKDVKNGFFVQTNEQLIEESQQRYALVTEILGALAGISLLVGGIGIMNIMLVSVTERTREIGIRVSVGARRRDIVLQFMVESAVVSAVGGVIGMLLGSGLGALICQAIDMPIVVSVKVIICAFLFSVSIGITFGIYPAKRGARLDPVESLRYE